MHPGEQVGIDDVRGRTFDDCVLVAFNRPRLGSRNPGRADIGEIGTERLSRQDRTSAGDRPGQCDRPAEPFADFFDKKVF